MNVLILGSDGFLGRKLKQFLEESDDRINIIADSHKYESASALINSVSESKPNFIFNCIAVTNAKKCEDSPEEAYWVNSAIPGLIANYSKSEEIRFIHLSTDAVLSYHTPFKCEDSEPLPYGVYASSKLDGERNVMQSRSNYLICRVNFFGLSHKKTSLLDFFVGNIKDGETCNGYTNVFFTPIGIDTLVQILWRLSSLKTQGVMHVTGNERISKYQFGKEVELIMNKNSGLVVPKEFNFGEGINSKDLSLCNCKLRGLLSIPLPDWKVDLERYLRAERD